MISTHNFAIENEFDISFIEEMPLGTIIEHDRAEAFYSSIRLLKTYRNLFHKSTKEKQMAHRDTCQ